MKDMGKLFHSVKPEMLMVFSQIAYAAVNIMCKLAIIDGMSMRIATAYRLMCAAACTVTLALIYDRNKRPKITWSVLFKAFLCGMFGGSLYLNLYLEALALTSATFMLAVVNLVPGITFIMAVSFGLDKFNLGAASGRAKLIGTIVGISGAMTMTFMKGFEIHLWSSNINLLHPHHNQHQHILSPHEEFRNKLFGVPCALAMSCVFSLWFIVQAKLNKEYPCHHSSAALMTTMGAIQATVFALCVDRDWDQWKLNNTVRILSVVYPGVVVSGIVVVVTAWCIKMRGPLFASIFNPLQLLVVAVAAYFMLDEKLYLGSVLGAVLIVGGLYAVLWGKSKEMKMNSTQLVPLEITKQSENVDIVVVSMPVDQNKEQDLVAIERR